MRICSWIAFAVLGTCASAVAADGHALVPLPREAEWTGGTCPATAEVSERNDPGIPAEGYRLDVASGAIALAASDAAGFFYGRQTLRQLKTDGGYPCCRIVDAPAYPWRGLHLDESRHFFGKETVLKLLDNMARFKLNVLHWHLTDNQGWRIPIPGYPKLTETVRPVENRLNFCDLAKTGTYGPHSYARADLQEVVRRAAELHIRIVPEVEIPGHSEALLKACPEFACTVTNREVDNAVCVGKDATLRFFEKALDEVCAIFPDAVVHIGGDECDRKDWKKCPDCRARMEREGLADVAALQSWTTAHFEKYLRGKGRRLMGWDEIAEGGLPPGTMVMSWRGTSTGIAAAKGGQDVVMTPNEYCYFDYSQGIEGDPMAYPYNWTVLLPLAKVYSFDPAKGIPDEYRPHVLGAQGNCWSEMIRTEKELEWKVWPRAAALAEVLWSDPKDRDFASFLRRMAPRRKDLVDSGVNAAPLDLRKDGARPRGELVRTKTAQGEELRYTCGTAVSVLSLEDGRLGFESPGLEGRKFPKNDFREIEVISPEDGVFFATARRRASEIVVTVLFDGDRIVLKDRYDYRNPEREIAELVAGMSVREKLGQLKQGVLYTRKDVDRYLPIVRKGEVGSFIFNETLKREWRDELQKVALESPHRIPLSFADNIIHGWRTNFPIPLALSCSFEPELFEEMAHVGAREGREAGLDWTFGPMCDTARDPRWGRVAEGCGEDPWLNGVYAAAQVRGFQGEDASAPDRVAACVKHYCGYSSSMGGHDYNDADFSEWSLRNLHLPPFAAAIDAGALTVMSGFNTVDGVPVLASRRIMTDILRGGLGFRGMVVTDYNAVIQTVTWGLAADEREAASLCLCAGNDVEMKSTAYDTLERELAEGRLDEAVIDEAVKRVLRFKQAVGLFRRPWAIPEPDAELRRREDAEALALARKCAVRSAVLVKNDGVLPLAADSDIRVALIGPLAEDRKTFVGCWAGMESHGPEVPESLADAVRRAMGGKGRLSVVRGCSTNVKPPVAKRDDGLPVLDRESVPDDASFDLEGAIAAAREADVVIFALGEALDWTGENASRCQLTPTGRQLELFEKVTSAIGKKRIVTLLISGRPLAVPVVSRRSDAVFVAFHGGDGGASALADLLFGKASPSGRLTVSVPYDVSQVPVFYNASATGRPNQGHYLDTPERGAMYPFGFGLTYTRFAYSSVSIRGRSAVARITNAGTRPGEEVVQLYIRQRACSEGVRPKRELRGFRKVYLEPGESVPVEFPLDAKTLGYCDRAGNWRCDSGTYDVFIAPDSASGVGMRFEWD